MTRDASKFVNITLKQEGYVIYGDNNKGKILGKGTIGNQNSFMIHDVFYVEGLKHNLLDISQLCDRGYQVIFKTNSCEICLPNSKEVMLVGKRINNVYLLDISNSTSIGSLLTKHEESRLWHRRIAHIHMHHLNKLISNDLLIGLPKLSLRRIMCVKLVQRGNKQNSLLN